MTATPTERPGAQGDVAALGRLLTSLADDRKTGVLLLRSRGVLRKLYLYQGQCCSLQSDRRDDQLGEVLVRVGWLTPDTLERIKARTGRRNPSTGELMLFIKPEDLPEGEALRDALRLHLQLIGSSTFSWHDFEAQFDPQSGDLPTSAGLEVDPVGLVGEGLSSIASDESIAHILAELGDAPVSVTRAASRIAYVLNEFFGEPLLRHVAERPRRVSEIVTSWSEPAAAKRVLAMLAVTGCLKVDSTPAHVAEPPSAKIPAAPEPPPGVPDQSGVPLPVLGSQTSAVHVIAPPPPVQDWEPAELERLLALNYFELLGVPQDIGTDALKETIKRLAAKYDPRSALPDRSDVRDLLSKVTSRVREAQITLLHPEVRRQYIGSLAGNASGWTSGINSLRAQVGGTAGAPAASAERQAAEAAQSEAKAMEQMGAWDRAREAMAAAIDAAPREADFHARMGWYTYKNSAMEPADRERLWKYHLEYALEINSNETLAHYYLGVIYANQGNLLRARIELTAAATGDPNFKAAKDALDRLGKPRDEKQPEPSGFVPLGGKKKKSKPVLLLVVFVLACLPLVLSLILGDPDHQIELGAQKIGANVKLDSVSRQEKTLLVQFDAKAWSALSANDKKTELMHIASACKGLGVNEVLFFTAGASVGQAIDGKVEE